MNGRAWTKKELAILRKRFATTPNHVLAKLVGHSAQSVQTIAMKRLGLHKQPFWTSVRIKQLKHLYPDSFLHELEKVFGVTGSAISHKAKILGLKKSARYERRRKEVERETQGQGRLIRGCHEWTEKESRVLRSRWANTSAENLAKEFHLTKPQVYLQAHKLGLQKDPEYIRETGRVSARTPNSIAARFKKGHPTWNKGMKGLYTPGSEKGWFKKGHLPQTTAPEGDGAIRIRIDKCLRTGRRRHYKWIRISKAKWRTLHVVMWERENGPVPPGHIVVFKNGDSMNCTVENLRLISHEQHAKETQDKDQFIAQMLSKRRPGLKRGKYDPELYRLMLQRPDLIEAKRQQLKLTRLMREKACTENNSAA